MLDPYLQSYFISLRILKYFILQFGVEFLRVMYGCVCVGGEAERDWAAVAAVQCRLDREGGTKLFTDLIMSTKNDKIFQDNI